MKNKLLIVIDMQNDFIDGALGSKEAEAIVPTVAKKIKAHEGGIIVTLDTHSEDYSETSEGAKLPVPHCIKGTNGFELNGEIQKALEGKAYTTIEKPTFGSTILPLYIAEHYDPNELEIELVGLCTDICVVSNALILKANFYETPISVDAECTAGVSPETKAAALKTMEMCQIDIKGE